MSDTEGHAARGKVHLPAVPGVTIRQATILDIPAIVRALPVPQAPEGVSASEMSQILRLTLTHVAIEHGAAWIAVGPAGEVLDSVLAVPTWELSGGHELPDLLAREADLEPEPEADPLESWLAALGKMWLIAHPVADGPAVARELLGTVAAWVGERARADGVPACVIAASAADREVALELGFTPQDAPGDGAGLGQLAWIGVLNL